MHLDIIILLLNRKYREDLTPFGKVSGGGNLEYLYSHQY